VSEEKQFEYDEIVQVVGWMVCGRGVVMKDCRKGEKSVLVKLPQATSGLKVPVEKVKKANKDS
jgi:hypothetical protein